MLLILLGALAGAFAPRAYAGEPAATPAKGTLTKPPELVTFVEAPFPEGVPQLVTTTGGVRATVVLAVTIRADGTVEDAVVQQSSGVVAEGATPDPNAAAFDAAAVAAAKQFVFSPAEVDGKPSRIRILYRYDFVERVVAPTTAVFAGVVNDREAHVPLPGVTVTLATPEGPRSVTTDAAGHFEFPDVPPGPLSVSLEGERLTPVSTEETFVAGERLEATYDVFLNEPGEDADDMEILVSAPALKRQAVSTEISAEDALKVPGTQGDVLRVVENLPGVARASLGTGALVVWGAAPEDTGVYVDGVPVPRLYHDGGLRSVVGSDFVKGVELVPGGYGAAYGRGLGGLVAVTTNRFTARPGATPADPVDASSHGTVTADVYDGAAALHGPVGSGEVGKLINYGAAGRYGYVGPLLSAFYPDVEDYFPIPHYYDAQGRIGFNVGPNQTLDVTALVSSDRTQRTAPSADPAREASERKTLDFQRVYLRYAHDVGDGSTVTALAYVGSNQSTLLQTYGQVETSVGTNLGLGGLRASYRARVAVPLTVEAGLDALLQQASIQQQGSLSVPTREGDTTVFGQPPPDQVSSDSFRVTMVNTAPYAEADLAPIPGHTDTLHVVAGVRLDPYARSIGSLVPSDGTSPVIGVYEQDLDVEPRVNVRLAPTDASFITAAWGRYTQAPQPADLSSAFGNPELPAAHGTHYVLGGGVAVVPTLSIAVTGFYTATTELAMRNPADQPAASEALVGSGLGRQYGGQTMIRLDPGAEGEWAKLYGWISYTLAWSERADGSLSTYAGYGTLPLGELDWRPSDYDQRHVLTALAGYELPLGLDFGVKVRFATGYPRTEVIGSYYDDRRDLYQPLFGDHNALRLPAFFEASARLGRKFVLKDSGIHRSELELSVEVENFTNRSNVEEYIYNADYSERGEITGLPVLPVLGAKWMF